MISGVASPGGAPARILRNVLVGRLKAVISPAIEREYVEKAFKRSVALLLTRHGVRIQDYLNVVAEVRIRAEMLYPTGEPPPCRDESDRKYLHCALFGRVDYLITRDHDLLTLSALASIPIVEPAQFLAVAERAGWMLEP